jgi:hypothetical protein
MVQQSGVHGPAEICNDAVEWKLEADPIVTAA